MFNFCHCHVQWCQKGCSRSVVMSKWAINFKNKPDPSTPKLSWRQQSFRSTLQIHKPSFIPQEVTTKKNTAFLLGRFQKEIQCVCWLCYYMNHTEKWSITQFQHEGSEWSEEPVISSGLLLSRLFGKSLILKTEFKLRFSHTQAT